MTLDPSRYDGEINDGGTLYNLLYYEEEGARSQTELLALNAQKIDTGNKNEIRPESGFHFSMNDWRGGSGQQDFHGPGSLANGFYSSDGIDVSVEGRAALLDDVEETLDWSAGGNTAIEAALEEVNGSTFASWGGHTAKSNIVFKHDGDFPGTWSEEDADDGEAGNPTPAGPTRLYPQNAAAPASPAFDSNWDDDSATRTNLAKTKSGVLAEVTLTESGTTKGALLQLVSPALTAGTAFTTSDEISAVFDVRESAGSPEGPNDPGTVADDATVGTISWSNPSNAISSNDSRAETTAGPGTSHYLKATNFGFSIPASATVTGITVEIERSASASPGVTDNIVSLVKAGAVVGDNKASATDWPTSDAYETYGGAAELWGTTWTPAEVNAADFGAVLSVTDAVFAVSRVDHIRITVHYTTSTQLAVIARVFDSAHAEAAVLYDSSATGTDTDWDDSGTAHGGSSRTQTTTNLTSAYTTSAGDYLVVEVGFRNESANDATAALSYGGTAADFPLASGNTSTATGWVEFSNGFLLASEATEPVRVYDLAAKGLELFAACGDPNGIHYRNAAGTWDHYNAATATIIRHLKDRLMAASATSLWEITASGAAPTALDTVETGWTYTDIAEEGPYIYVSAVNETAGISRIYHFGLNSAGTDLEAKGSTKLPRNQLAYSIAGNGGLWIGCGRRTSGTAQDSNARDPILYLGIPSATGELTLVKIAEDDDQETTSREVRAVEPIEEGVMVGWTPDEFRGSARYDASRGAFVFDLSLEDIGAGQGRVTDILRSFKGRTLMAVPSHGVFYEDLDTKRATGELVTSMADFGSAGMKLWDEIRIQTNVLPAGASIAVYYTTQHPDEDDWTLAGTFNTAGDQGDTFDLSNVKGRALALRFVFTRATDTSTGPELLGFTVRAFPCAEQTSDLEWRFNRYIRLFEGDSKGDNPPDHSTAGPWGGDARARRKALHDLAYKKVTLTEPDATWSVRIVGIADFEPMQPLPKSLTEKDEAYVVSMTFEGRRTA